MGVRACRACGDKVAATAPRCPHCGVKYPGGAATGCGGCGLALLLGVAVLVLLSLVACGGDSATGPGTTDQPRAVAGWEFVVDCPGRTTIFVVESVAGANLHGTQYDDLGGIVDVNPATSTVAYGSGIVTYSEGETPHYARTGTLDLVGDRYEADATAFCGYPSGTVWPNGPPIMTFGLP